LNWEGGSTNRRAVRVGVVEAGRAVPGPSASRPTVSAVDGVDLAGDGSHHRDRARSRAASFAASQSRTTNVRLLPSRLTTLLVPVIGLMGPGLLGVGPGRQRRSGPRVGVATGPPLPGRKPAPGSAAPPGHSRRGLPQPPRRRSERSAGAAVGGIVGNRVGQESFGDGFGGDGDGQVAAAVHQVCQGGDVAPSAAVQLFARSASGLVRRRPA